MLEVKDHAEIEANFGIAYCIYSIPGGDSLNVSGCGVAGETAPNARTTMQRIDSSLKSGPCSRNRA